jgi:hypothetical protein
VIDGARPMLANNRTGQPPTSHGESNLTRRAVDILFVSDAAAKLLKNSERFNFRFDIVVFAITLFF